MVYKLTSNFPPEERFGLTNQLRRAAVSIPSNIAEGKGRVTQGEMLQFIGTARGSTLEVQTQLEIAVMLGYEGKEAIDQAHMLASEILRILNASIATMRSRIATKGKRL